MIQINIADHLLIRMANSIGGKKPNELNLIQEMLIKIAVTQGKGQEVRTPS